MGASPALAVRLERTFHDVGSLATFERWRRNVDNIEPSRWVSIKPDRSRMAGFVTVEIVCYSRLPCGTVGSPPEVFHNCGKKCGKATVFAPLLDPDGVVTRVFVGRRPRKGPFIAVRGGPVE
jgi:hypothetical protein